jgi:hypothetical protein
MHRHPIHARRRALPWRAACLHVGTVLSIGGAMVFVSTPTAGAFTFAIGVLALLAGASE